jgi:type II restriction enzyme
LENFFSSSIGVLKFLGETELSLIFQEVTNLVDFVFGVEVGLDTNARKNRTGKNMHSKIANIFRKENLPFQEEVQISELPNISLGLDENKFDFVIEAKRTYLIEVNFYNSGGSKLNEVARSYTEIAKKLNSENIQFVWITDGQGWKKAKNKLEEAYKNIPHLYNLHSLETFLQKVKSEI